MSAGPALLGSDIQSRLVKSVESSMTTKSFKKGPDYPRRPRREEQSAREIEVLALRWRVKRVRDRESMGT